jgi:hypothetical protein
MVVMDQYRHRIIGLGVHDTKVDGSALTNIAIRAGNAPL